jgi:hypothetical protein
MGIDISYTKDEEIKKDQIGFHTGVYYDGRETRVEFTEQIQGGAKNI